MRLLKNLILLSALAALASGCATIPSRIGLPSYNINGVSYISLAALCQSRGIKMDYDAYARTIGLSRDDHHLKLMVGDRLLLVDGVPQRMKHPVEMYEGVIAVPYKFKEQVVDVLFKEEWPLRKKTAVPLTRFKKIVVDAGHGGRDPGAMSRSGLCEKALTLDMAKRLKKLLEADGFQVVMTRSTDTFIPLDQRVEIANRSGADLFISIHINASRVRSLSGFEAYYITPNINDSKRALNAARSENPGFARNCFAGSSTTLKAILWDMSYTYDRGESIELARAVARSVARDLNLRVLGVKGANFHVLRGARMPAVLLEAGFISNSGEERLLRNSYYRQQLVEAIDEGIRDYVIEYPVMEGKSE